MILESDMRKWIAALIGVLGALAVVTGCTSSNGVDNVPPHADAMAAVDEGPPPYADGAPTDASVDPRTCIGCIYDNCGGEYSACLGNSGCGGLILCIKDCNVEFPDAGPIVYDGGAPPDAGAEGGALPASLGDCVARCYAFDGGAPFAALLADCLSPSGPCHAACDR